MNDKNLDFYRNIDLDFFKRIAVLQGFDTCHDIDVIWDYFKNAAQILELGAGYGRSVMGILDRNFQGKITAIERCPELVEYLQKNLPKKVSIIQQDLRFFELDFKPNVILLIWSGILELSRLEQIQTVKHISENLPTDGVFITEIPRQVKYVGVHVGKQEIRVETEWGTLDAYMPTHQEMLDFVEIGNFKSVKTIDYTTPTDLQRAFYVYEK